MEQLQNFGDIRQTSFCVYCGQGTETRDHVPSKVFLDEPYPTNLPVVPACQACNEGFSLDEEYVACLLDCALAGSAGPEEVEREKIRRILRQKPALVSKFSQACKKTAGETFFDFEIERVRNVVLKLARGHAAYELNEPQLDDPSHLAFVPFPTMTSKIRENFEALPVSSLSLWPEMGSRAMQRILLGADMDSEGWIVVQPSRYRYLTSVDCGVLVRMVIGQYLACEVVWDLG